MQMDLPDILPSESVKDYAYRVLHGNIIDIQLKPGQAITEKSMAEILKISRTPVREAFARLLQENLLDIYPQRGTFVSLIDLRRVEESKFMRLSLEKSVMERACADFPSDALYRLEENLNRQEFCHSHRMEQQSFDLDNQLHRIIFCGCGFDHIWDMIRMMSADYDRVRTLKLTRLCDGDILEDHRALVKAIREKDPVPGLRVMEKHIMQLDEDKAILREQFPMYFR